MLGIVLTLIAVLLVICFAFCYADHPLRGEPNAEAFFYGKPKGTKKNLNRADQ
jgi:hypothetical protein